MHLAKWFQGLTVTTALLLPTAHAFATEPVDARAACKADTEKFCKDIKPGGGRIIACLKAHAPDLSPGCAAAFTEKKGEAMAAMVDCKPDTAKFCPGVKPGEGRIMMCLKAHEVELTPACKAHFGPKPAPAK